MKIPKFHHRFSLNTQVCIFLSNFMSKNHASLFFKSDVNLSLAIISSSFADKGIKKKISNYNTLTSKAATISKKRWFFARLSGIPTSALLSIRKRANFTLNVFSHYLFLLEIHAGTHTLAQIYTNSRACLSVCACVCVCMCVSERGIETLCSGNANVSKSQRKQSMESFRYTHTYIPSI